MQNVRATTKSASIPILAAISTLPVIAACALLGATEARAVTCSADATACDPYVVTLDQVGSNVVATSNQGGEFDLTGLNSFANQGAQRAQLNPSFAFLFLIGNGQFTRLWRAASPVTGPSNFGSGTIALAPGIMPPGCNPQNAGCQNSTGPAVGFQLVFSQLALPTTYMTSGVPLDQSQAIWSDQTFTSLGISAIAGNVAPNIYRWSWGSAADQSFTIDVVPLPAALPLFASGIGGLGLLGWRRKRRARAVA